jgi:hypothetical protein
MPNETASRISCCFCHCTPEHPCKVSGGDECSYVYMSKPTRCSAPKCEIAFAAKRRADLNEDTRIRKMFTNLRNRKSFRKGRAA